LVISQDERRTENKAIAVIEKSCWGWVGWWILQQVPSYTIIGTSQGDSAPAQTFSPLGKAFSENDLTAVHEILVKRGYKDDEVLQQLFSAAHVSSMGRIDSKGSHLERWLGIGCVMDSQFLWKSIVWYSHE
jgi:hypothetical protein